jgi:hypothetical protein
VLTFAACEAASVRHAAPVFRVVPLLALVGCAYMQGSLGAQTPAAGGLDRGAQTRLAGTLGMGMGYVGWRGGVVGGLLVERVPSGKYHAGIGPFGLVTVGLKPGLSVFGRVTYTTVVNHGADKGCTDEICGKAFGIAVGPQLVRVLAPREGRDSDDHDSIEDGPSVGGAGLALAYRREDLNGAIGHYVGLELSVLFGGALTSSRR